MCLLLCQNIFVKNLLEMDVATVRNENASLRKIQQKLLQWDTLAPLTTNQLDFLEQLNEICDASSKTEVTVKSSENAEQANKSVELPSIKSEAFNELQTETGAIESTQKFLAWYNRVDLELYEKSDEVHQQYYEQLLNRSRDCDNLIEQIDSSLTSLNLLSNDYNFVADKTSSLNTASEKLILEQRKLNEIGDEIKQRLHYFTQAELLSQRLHSPMLSVASEIFMQTLNSIDECLSNLKSNPKFKDGPIYTNKYKQCLAKAVLIMKVYVNNIFVTATEQVLESKQSSRTDEKSSEAAFAIYYGKFQASAPKAKFITTVIEERLDRNIEYEQLLSELHQSYLSQRANVSTSLLAHVGEDGVTFFRTSETARIIILTDKILVMSSEVERSIKDLTLSYKRDHCALVRSACAFIVHVSQDEHRLFYQFFNIASSQLVTYLDGLCTILYDILRPFIIHINHLETLAEICSILRVEMIEEHVQHNPESLEAFGKIANQLLQDVQERLVFRAHLYLQSDILNYKPSSGDLAYPEKLEMMESIAISLQEPILKRADSRASMVSVGSEIDSITSAAEQQLRARTGNSPADLHGMWYPTVRRTLVCLSRLYRCIDRPIFQGLSQEALTFCIQSVSNAAQQIASKKTIIDGELFEIKHLLIIREQIAPFRVDFTVKETSLDFSKVKTAAFGLLQKRKQLFAIGTNNALLEFLLDGTPQVKEHLHDSRKDVDRQLKLICEQFIRDATKLLVEPLTNFLEKAQNLLKQPQSVQSPGQAPAPKINYALRQTPWASPQQISGIIQESQRLIKSKLSTFQRSMQLYLSNRDTEFILFRPIRNNIIGAFVKLEQTLTTNGYSNDDLIITSCPTADQISLLLSSASVMMDNNLPLSQQNSRRISSSSIENEKVSRKSSVEKKVSFDKSVSEVDELKSATEVESTIPR
ncbi:Conserved oligomeric Golgi complex subunit 3 [Pseudolycoriella hygida]|uniref:Conserved oligomeric Golgi complex subunit 3 n=1 Tax=Pseudolycoriella hygida TaxID=35572 RepID=A0A9Q0NDV6_9DIPT|nr:Conserved oligomeric Golgi complex subunit 3 [Pseudolycoriella hygida]